MADSVQWNHCGVPWRKHSAIRTKAFKPAELKVTQTGGNNSAGKLLDVTVRGDPPISTPWLLRRNSHRFKAHSASRKTEPQLFRPAGNITESSVGHPIVPSGQLLLGWHVVGLVNSYVYESVAALTLLWNVFPGQKQYYVERIPGQWMKFAVSTQMVGLADAFQEEVANPYPE